VVVAVAPAIATSLGVMEIAMNLAVTEKSTAQIND
jgi:hypothetical protein